MVNTLHEQLLEATAPLLAGEVYSAARLNAPMAAARAVVELHAPEPCANGAECCLWCAGCSAGVDHSVAWVDCQTIKAVASALGVEIAE